MSRDADWDQDDPDYAGLSYEEYEWIVDQTEIPDPNVPTADDIWRTGRVGG